MPVIIDVRNADWAYEAAMIAAAARRGVVLVDGEDAARAGAVQAALDAAAHHGLLSTVPLLADWDSPLAEHPAVRAMRLDTMTPAPDAGGAVELAAALGAADHTTIAIAGAAGGAGTSTLAVLIAHALWSTDTPCALAECQDLTAGVDLVLGKEMEPGWRIHDVPEVVDLTKLHKNLPEVFGSGSLLVARGVYDSRRHTTQSLRPTTQDSAWQSIHAALAPQWTVVADCGLYSHHPWDTMAAHTRVLIAPMTVPGVTSARRICDTAATHGEPAPLVILREVPNSMTTINLAQLILGVNPQAVLPYDPHIPAAVDTGDLAEYLCHTYPSGHPMALEVVHHINRARAAGAASLRELV